MPAMLATLLVLSACKGNKNNTPALAADTTCIVDTTAAEQVTDSTIYGKASEDFGMSTFGMITDDGDTLNVCRTANDGTDAKIYGSIKYDDRYAMTTRDNGESLGVLINLTELDKKTQELRNTQRALGGERRHGACGELFEITQSNRQICFQE